MSGAESPQGSVTIRSAQERDVAQILEFIRALAKYERLEHEVSATEASLHETLFGPLPAASVLFACVDSQPVGFALYFTNYSTFLGRPGLYLEDLFVLPSMRGRGVGRALFEALAKEAMRRRYGRLDWSVLAWNTPAIEFYRRLGAVHMQDWQTFRLTGDALLALGREVG